jgi:hypothetical protein
MQNGVQYSNELHAICFLWISLFVTTVTTSTKEIQNCDIIPKDQTPLTNIVETKDVLSSGISLTCIRTI